MSKWKCPHCSKEYTNEKRFFTHTGKCPMKEKIDRCRTLQGSIAFSAYNYWMKKTRKGEQTIETFISSRFFTSCMRFAEFYLETSVGSMEKYIDFMIKRNYDFTMWSSHVVFAEYVYHYDSIHPPIDQWNHSFDLIEQRCIDYNCSPTEVFKHIGLDDMMILIIRRKLSNWYLLLSKGFWDWMGTLPPEQKNKVLSAMKPDLFFNVVSANPALHRELSDLTKAVEGIN
jgi:hypothetical protein